jgi:hypothetical protein
MTTNPLCTLPFPSRHALACSLLLLSALNPARADAAPGVIVPLAYSTTFDVVAGTASFAVQFDRAPDFFTLDSANRAADAFQFWTDTVSTNPIASTYAGILGTGPLGTQMIVTASYLPITNQLSFVWPQLVTDAGPKDPGGWGSVEAFAGYTLSADHTLRFDVPLALLHAVGGNFNYGFETYQYGSWGAVDYFGASGQSYVPCVPEPVHGVMLGAGLLLVAGARRRTRR